MVIAREIVMYRVFQPTIVHCKAEYFIAQWARQMNIVRLCSQLSDNT